MPFPAGSITGCGGFAMSVVGGGAGGAVGGAGDLCDLCPRPRPRWCRGSVGGARDAVPSCSSATGGTPLAPPHPRLRPARPLADCAAPIISFLMKQRNRSISSGSRRVCTTGAGEMPAFSRRK